MSLKPIALAAACALPAAALFGYPNDPVTLNVSTASKGAVINPEFLGLSWSRDSISGDGGYTQLFDSALDPGYLQLQNLCAQIGIKHFRTICGSTDDSPDPLAAQDNNFFTFAQGAGVTNVVYSLHLYGEDMGFTRTSNTVAAANILGTSPDSLLIKAFAFDNETDWPGNNNVSGDGITGYSTGTPTGAPSSGPGYSGYWTYLAGQITGAPAFVGPDAFSVYPMLASDPLNPQPNHNLGASPGKPYAYQFAKDHVAQLAYVTQHFYGASTTNIPTWVTGSSYSVNDVVKDPGDSNMVFLCKVSISPSNTHPSAVPANWVAWTSAPAWTSGSNYNPGNVVKNAFDGDIYQCLKAVASDPSRPDLDKPTWILQTAPNVSPLQMALNMLDASWVTTNYPAVDTNVLGDATGWPSGLKYRFTEVSPYSGGNDVGGQTFATALWSLDFCHWWARHGCLGVNPFDRTVQTDAPIFNPDRGGTNYVAMPYAYGLAAFGLASGGNTVNASGITWSNPDNVPNLTAYAVAGTSDLFVTIINKNFNSVGSFDATTTINLGGFTATSARYMVLTSGTPGNATAVSATLGGSTIPATGTFTPSWTALTKTAGAWVINVQSTTAVIVDFKN